MTKLTLRDWASVAEIVGTIAVVVSLLFVAYSVNHNTEVLQSLNDNLLYEYDEHGISDVTNDPSMAAILVKLDNNEQLTAIENERFLNYRYRTLNMWELAHDRYVEGLFPEEKWLGWSASLGYSVTRGPRRLPKKVWEANKIMYGSDFGLIVDQAYAAED